MRVTIAVAALAGLLKKLGSMGADLVELSVDKAASLKLKGGRADRGRNLPDPTFIVELSSGAPVRHALQGVSVVALKGLQNAIARCEGQILLAQVGGRLHLRARLAGGQRLELSFPTLGDPLPELPQAPKGASSLTLDEAELALVLAKVKGALPSAAASSDGKLSDVVLELVAKGNASTQAVINVGACNGTLVLVQTIHGDSANLELGETLRLPAAGAQALGGLGGGSLELCWGNQLVIHGTEASLAVPLSALPGPSYLLLVKKAAPSGRVSKPECRLNKADLAQALEALKAAATDATAKVAISKAAGKGLTLVLEGSPNAEGRTEIVATHHKGALSTCLSLAQLLQAVAAVDDGSLSLAVGGEQDLVNLITNDGSARGTVAVLSPFRHAAIPASAPVVEAAEAA